MKDKNEENSEQDVQEFIKNIKQEIEEQEMYNEYQNKKLIKNVIEEHFLEKKPFDKWFDFEE